jgi:type I restriction enzyme S subunit
MICDPNASLFEPAFPANWPRRSLWDTATWQNGLAFRDVSFSEGGAPVIKIAELKGGISANTKRTRQQFDDKYRVRVGDVLYSWSGSPETSLDVFVWSGETGWLNQHIFKIHTVDDVSRAFHIQLLRYLRPNLVSLATNKQTTGLGHVTQQDFRRLVIGVPSLNVQRAIASILSALDDKIELNRRMNETLEELARTLFKSWFVDFDQVKAKAEGRQPVGMDAETAALFPSRFVESELGRIPEGWSVGRLDDLLELQRGFDLPTQQRIPGPFPVVTASGPTEGHAEFKVRGPGVVTGRSGVLGRVFLVLEDFWPLNTSLWVKEFKRSGPHYAYLALQRLDFAAYNAGSAVPTLNRNHIHGLPHVLPTSQSVDRFEALVKPLYQRLRHNDVESLTLAQLRDLLLPKLMSGELRVPDAEKLAEGVP